MHFANESSCSTVAMFSLPEVVKKQQVVQATVLTTCVQYHIYTVVQIVLLDLKVFTLKVCVMVVWLVCKIT